MEVVSKDRRKTMQNNEITNKLKPSMLTKKSGTQFLDRINEISDESDKMARESYMASNFEGFSYRQVNVNRESAVIKDTEVKRESDLSDHNFVLKENLLSAESPLLKNSTLNVENH